MHVYQKKGFLVGLVLFTLMLFLPAPSGLNAVGWSVAAIVVLMAVWWATEAIPVAVTALLPLALFPLVGVTSLKGCIALCQSKHISIPWWLHACFSN